MRELIAIMRMVMLQNDMLVSAHLQFPISFFRPTAQKRQLIELKLNYLLPRRQFMTHHGE
jgi:hypothetical protein